jgi:aspartyl-tRNA(Asn)/glutamyl-tRNA(Gln) amidotransferase subunit B
VTREKVTELKAALPELPDAKRARLREEYGLTDYEANLLAESRAKADFFDSTVATLRTKVDTDAAKAAKLTANWQLGELSRSLNDAGLEVDSADMKVTPESFAGLLDLVNSGKVSGTAAKEVLSAMFASGRDAQSIVAERGLGTIEDNSVVSDAVAKVLAVNEKAIGDYRAGKVESLKFLVGQVMKETRGRANAADVQTLLMAALDLSSGQAGGAG